MIPVDSHNCVLLVEIIQYCLANNNLYYDLKNCTQKVDTNNVKNILDSKYVKDIIKNIYTSGAKKMMILNVKCLSVSPMILTQIT